MNVVESKIVGLFEVTLDVLGDRRGSFREAWQTAKMEALGLPHFAPVQMNVSESTYGTIRGIHAEPWGKYIHIAAGEVWAAIVDLRRDSETFGQVETFTLNQSNAIFLPRGMGNSFAVTSERAVYTYLVTEHWSPDNPYPAVAFDDPALAIDWPIPKADRIVSDKDRSNQPLAEAYPT